MSQRCREATVIHTRLLKCTLEVDHCRAYWQRPPRTSPSAAASANQAFDEYWFGARSLARAELLLANMRARFDAFPAALATLHAWPRMSPATRSLICHWHVQLSDPLYRAFTGSFLPSRRAALHAEVSLDLVTRWVGEQVPRWMINTRTKVASKLLTTAHSAGLVASRRDPRPLLYPRVPDDALEYLLYLLREVEIEGSLLENAYLASVGLSGSLLEQRLRGLPSLSFGRQGDLIDFGWRFRDLSEWADANLRPLDDQPMVATR